MLAMLNETLSVNNMF